MDYSTDGKGLFHLFHMRTVNGIESQSDVFRATGRYGERHEEERRAAFPVDVAGRKYSHFRNQANNIIPSHAS